MRLGYVCECVPYINYVLHEGGVYITKICVCVSYINYVLHEGGVYKQRLVEPELLREVDGVCVHVFMCVVWWLCPWLRA